MPKSIRRLTSAGAAAQRAEGVALAHSVAAPAAVGERIQKIRGCHAAVTAGSDQGACATTAVLAHNHACLRHESCAKLSSCKKAMRLGMSKRRGVVGACKQTGLVGTSKIHLWVVF